MKVLYHGTSVENINNIEETGKFGNSDKQTWTVADRDYTYFYHCENEEETVYSALGNAQITCAVQDSKYTSVGLIVLTVMDGDMQEFERDYSCENMSENAYCIDNDVLNSLIDGGHVLVDLLTIDDVYNPYLRPFYLASLKDNQYLNRSNFSDSFLEALDMVSKIDISGVDSFICEKAFLAAENYSGKTGILRIKRIDI